jgi:hypothetical protein
VKTLRGGSGPVKRDWAVSPNYGVVVMSRKIIQVMVAVAAALAVLGAAVVASRTFEQTRGSAMPFLFGHLVWTDCSEDVLVVSCGSLELSHRASGETALIHATLLSSDVGGADPRVLVWRPGGPGLAAAQALRNNPESHLIGPMVNGRILAVDPPRLPDGEFAITCGIDEQTRFLDALVEGTIPELQDYAMVLGASCESDPWAQWALADEMAAIRLFLNDINPQAAIIHAVSFGGRGLGALTATGLVERITLDSPSSLSHNRGLDHVLDHAEATVSSWRLATENCEGCEETLRTIAKNGVGDMTPVSVVAGIVGLLRNSGHDRDDVIRLLEQLRHGEVSPLLSALSSQTLRRYADSRFSPLNIVFLGQVCAEFEWEEADLPSLLKFAEESPLSRFVSGMYLPCFYWPHDYRPADVLVTSDTGVTPVPVVLVSSTIDAVAPRDESAEWRERVGLYAEVVVKRSGHGSLVPDLPSCSHWLFQGPVVPRDGDTIVLSLEEGDQCLRH